MAEGPTEDGFLGGRVRVFQPRKGFRSGVDAVLLAAAVPAEPGQRVLELGTGAGVASLCLAARVPDLKIDAVELQPDYADLARKNAGANGAPVTVHVGDVADLPPAVSRTAFDHVFANPPYHSPGARTGARDPGREAALAETRPLAEWVEVMVRRLKPRGWLTVIQKAERLDDLIHAVGGRIGSVTLKPISPRTGRPAQLVILRARKGGRAGLKLLAPLIMHRGMHHEADGDDYSDAASAILRHGARLDD